jgi:hypothetical protein
MPVLIPIIVAGAAYFGTGAVLATAFGTAMVGAVGATVAGVVVGAVIGAAVGAIGAAVTGGSIGKGALWGAVGGAVAGGVAGYGSVAAGASEAESVGANFLSPGQAAAAQNAPLAATTEATKEGMSAGAGLVLSSGVETAGDMMTGYAQGEAAGKISEEDRAAAEQARKEQFEQNLKELRIAHSGRMDEIRKQGAIQENLADKNNSSQMALLNTRIGADKDTAQATINDRENEQGQFSDSVMGTDANLFNRPTFAFDPGTAVGPNFDSGFDEAAAASPNAPQPTPEEKIAIEAAAQ